MLLIFSEFFTSEDAGDDVTEFPGGSESKF